MTWKQAWKKEHRALAHSFPASTIVSGRTAKVRGFLKTRMDHHHYLLLLHCV